MELSRETRMRPEALLNELSSRLAAALASSPAKDLERNARAMLTAGFAKLDLVTREEFDVQARVLARTREKLAELEARVASLEGAPAPSRER
jgi:BMFP domain-containing protein YqiC